MHARTLTKARRAFVGVDYGSWQVRGVAMVGVTFANTVQLARLTVMSAF